MNKQHCKEMFNHLGIDDSGLDNYDEYDELTQEDLDNLTGWQKNYKEICSMHQVMRRFGIFVGIIGAITILLLVIRKRRTAQIG